MTTEFSAGGAASRPRPTSNLDWDHDVTGWTGWIAFAAAMLMLIGSFHAIEGLVGIFRNEEVFLAPKENLAVSIDYTAWGWIHLILGLLAIGVGIGLFVGQTWARVFGVLLAIISSVVNLAFLSAYPVWSVMIIAFNVILIWALTVHGREMKYRGDDV
jgi:hypothetical protein